MNYLIAGLGNIGPQYELTRHNIGFLVLDRLADQHQVEFDSDRLAFTAQLRHRGRTLYLIKPTTFMNLSGRAVGYWLKLHKIPIQNLLVVTDDLALPYGKLRLKGQGSAGGHNGLANIQQTLNTSQYARLRFGIGQDFARGRQVDYVLSPFSPAEFAEITTHLDRAADMILGFAAIGLERTMNEFN